MEQKTQQEPAHASLGASVASRWIACPGSNNLIERSDLPVGGESEHAREGTAAHKLADLAIKRGKKSAGDWLGLVVEGVEVTEEMVDAVDCYLGEIDEIREYATEWWSERRFNLKDLNPPGPMFGTSDFVAVSDSTLYVVDFKYGRGVVVEAKNNPQLMYYALGAALSLVQIPPVISMSIVQPRAIHPEGVIRRFTISSAELLEFSLSLMEAAHATTDPHAPLAAGAHCRWCPASGGCPAQLALAQEQAMVVFTDEVPVLRTPETLSEDELIKVMRAAPLLQEWVKGVQSYVKSKLERGDEIGGYKLVANRPSRKWAEADLAQETLTQVFSDEDILVKKLKSPAQVEKALGKENYKAYAEQYVIKSSSGSIIVPGTDPRPSLGPVAAQAFAALAAGETSDDY